MCPGLQAGVNPVPSRQGRRVHGAASRPPARRVISPVRAGESEWLRSGSVNVQQQALRDFWRAKSAFFKSGFGHPTWRRKHHDEGFRITDTCDVERLNRHWARVKVPKVGWVRFRPSRPGVPVAKSYPGHLPQRAVARRVRRQARPAARPRNRRSDRHRPRRRHHRRPVRWPQPQLPPAHQPGTRSAAQAPAPRGPRPKRQPAEGRRVYGGRPDQGPGGRASQGLVREDQHHARH